MKKVPFKEGASIDVNACLAGLGSKPIAEAFSNTQGVTSSGLMGDGAFSSNANKRGVTDRVWSFSSPDNVYLKAYDGGSNNRFQGSGSVISPRIFKPK